MDDLSQLTAILPHSCYPNCAVNSRNQLVLLRHVPAGEALTIDYATLYSGNELLLDCRCGYNGCRGKILGFNYLPVFFQDYYLEKDAVGKEVLMALNLNSANC